MKWIPDTNLSELKFDSCQVFVIDTNGVFIYIYTFLPLLP